MERGQNAIYIIIESADGKEFNPFAVSIIIPSTTKKYLHSYNFFAPFICICARQVQIETIAILQGVRIIISFQLQFRFNYFINSPFSDGN
jgi:hypothetical protein